MGEFPQGESTAGTQGGAEGDPSEGEAGSEDGDLSDPGDLGEFPEGESTAGTQDGDEADASEGESGTEDPGESEGEPGFGSGDYATSDSDALPDLRDEETLEEALESFEEAMGEAGDSGEGDPATAGSDGDSAEEGGTAGGTPTYAGTGTSDSTGNDENQSNSGAGTGRTGPLTPAEQAAILDGYLERGTGEFDEMILEEQAAQRRAAREQLPSSATTSASTGNEAVGGFEEGGGEVGVYSTGGGMGGASRAGDNTEIPSNTVKYPPPANIPSGNDDDVFARQLREAAMREPDPTIREKLWDEYRNYKGIN